MVIIQEFLFYVFEISFSMYNSRKICMSQRKIMETVIALGKKNMYFIMKTLLIIKRTFVNEH